MAATIGGLGWRIAVPRAVNKTALLLILGMLSILGSKNIQGANASNAPLTAYPVPFKGSEVHSTDITPFYKWTGMLARMDARTQPLRPWLDNRKMLESLPAADMVQKVDDFINSYDYVADIINWGVSDYWETPAEFFAHGGDCEDFAIAKYAWLRSLGVAEERLRIAIVYDRIKDMPHAVLILYINNKAMILDNQVRDIRDSSTTSRYRMVYSINRLGWWFPAKSEDDKLSMVEDMKRQSSNAIQFSPDCLAGASRPKCINAIEPAAR
jgi:predicted transglutaminase-like cysteine proteinase